MFDVRNSIYSLSDFKRNDPEVAAQLEETGGPIVLTVNGKAKYVVLDTANYQKMVDTIEEFDQTFHVKINKKQSKLLSRDVVKNLLVVAV